MTSRTKGFWFHRPIKRDPTTRKMVDADYEILFINEWTPALTKAIRSQRARVVWINAGWNNTARGIDFLADHSDEIRELTVDERAPVADFSAISTLKKLRSLSVGSKLSPTPNIDFGKLNALRKLGWGAKSLGNVPQAKNLERLALVNVRLPSLHPLSPLSRLKSLAVVGLRSMDGAHLFPKLEELSLGSSNMVALDSVDEFPCLEWLSVVALRQLVDLSALPKMPHLKSLVIALSKKAVHDLKAIGGCEGLVDLQIEDMGTIPSIVFLKSLKLRSFKLVGETLVGDKDLSVLLKIPTLKEVFFADRRGYSHKQAEIEAMLGPASPPRK